jgi:hypothetical protein
VGCRAAARDLRTHARGLLAIDNMRASRQSDRASCKPTVQSGGVPACDSEATIWCCGKPRLLFAHVGARIYCADCWRAAGQPFPTERLSDKERAEIGKA